MAIADAKLNLRPGHICRMSAAACRERREVWLGTDMGEDVFCVNSR